MQHLFTIHLSKKGEDWLSLDTMVIVRRAIILLLYYYTAISDVTAPFGKHPLLIISEHFRFKNHDY